MRSECDLTALYFFFSLHTGMSQLDLSLPEQRPYIRVAIPSIMSPSLHLISQSN